MSLSSFEEKFEESRNNNFFLSSSEDEDEEEDWKKKKKFLPRMMMESQQRKIEEKFSFRVLSYQKKRSTLCLHSIFTTRKNNKARARGCSRVCVCVCRFRE